MKMGRREPPPASQKEQRLHIRPVPPVESCQPLANTREKRPRPIIARMEQTKRNLPERRLARGRCDVGTGFKRRAAMSLSEYCRHRALDCRIAAQVDVRRKKRWLRLAASWSDLADEIEQRTLSSGRAAD